MRNAYNEQLQTLHRELTEMGAMCETAVSLGGPGRHSGRYRLGGAGL